MTLKDSPQGEPNATVRLVPDVAVKPFYFGVTANNDTNPFARGLTATSLDGGVLWANIPASAVNTTFQVIAEKPGRVFRNTELFCVPGKRVLVNGAPPYGPIVVQEET